MDPDKFAKLGEIMGRQGAVLTSGTNSDHLIELARLDIEFYTNISKTCGNEIIHEILIALITSLLNSNAKNRLPMSLTDQIMLRKRVIFRLKLTRSGGQW